jgi:DNA polymerase-3 subunit delta'
MIYPWNAKIWQGLNLTEREIGSAVLLVGPDGVGKAEFAQSLAQALLCTQPAEHGASCGACMSCRLFDAGNHPDYRQVEAGASEADGGDNSEEGAGKPRDQASSRWIKVEQVRALWDFLALSAHFGGRKVVVVQGAERLHASAANALLKTLEEPPPRTHLILVTGRSSRLPATIRSRCVRIQFTLPNEAVATAWLQEQGATDANATLALAQTGYAPLKARDLDTPAFWSQRSALIDQVLSGGRLDPVALSERAAADTLTALVGGLQRWCYDLLLYKSAGRVRYNPDCAQILHRLAVRATPHALTQYMRELQVVARTLEHPLNPRLVMERCLFGYRRVLTVSESQ